MTDEEVADAVQQTITSIRRQFGSELEYAQELKKAGFQTPQEFRRYRMEQQRRVLLQNRLIEALEAQGKLPPIQPTEQELREYYDLHIAGVAGARPATISFRQIVIDPKPSQAALDSALALADSIVTMDPKRPSAQGLAIQDGKLLAIGSQKEVLALSNRESEVVERTGACVLPGLIEPHTHPDLRERRRRSTRG